VRAGGCRSVARLTRVRGAWLNGREAKERLFVAAGPSRMITRTSSSTALPFRAASHPQLVPDAREFSDVRLAWAPLTRLSKCDQNDAHIANHSGGPQQDRDKGRSVIQMAKCASCSCGPSVRPIARNRLRRQPHGLPGSWFSSYPSTAPARAIAGQAPPALAPVRRRRTRPLECADRSELALDPSANHGIALQSIESLGEAARDAFDHHPALLQQISSCGCACRTAGDSSKSVSSFAIEISSACCYGSAPRCADARKILHRMMPWYIAGLESTSRRGESSR